MNPPLRSAADREALLEGLIDGTIDCIATDHAPHSHEEKSKGLAGSAFGVVGLETAFPVLYTYLVKTGKVALSRIVDALSIKPRQRFGIPFGNDFSVWELDACEAVDPNKFLSKGRATPFEGWKLYGKNVLTVCDGNIVYRENN
jgi:dihydroorotase